MAMHFTISEIRELSSGVWEASVSPAEIQALSSGAQRLGGRSVVMLSDFRILSEGSDLSFRPSDATVLNIGNSDSTVFLGLIDGTSFNEVTPQPKGFTQGDRSFLRLASSEMSGSMAAVAEELLLRVRARSPGELKRGKTRNFSETPDNFWYVILQPRIDEISITVRGSVDHFTGVGKLELKDDRGNTRFKIRNSSDLADAEKLIFHALRKG